jgi:hypothetical protein
MEKGITIVSRCGREKGCTFANGSEREKESSSVS